MGEKMSLKKWDNFISEISSKFNSDWAGIYIKALRNRERQHLKNLYTEFSKNRNETVDKIEKICMCLDKQHQNHCSSPYHFTRLPVLANEVLSDPHALDKGTKLGGPFLHALSIIHNEPFAKDALKRAEHYMYSGIIMCDISSYVTFSGLIEIRTDGEDINRVWEEACKRKEVLQIPLRNIMHLRSIRPYKGNRVYVVENPSVFSSILDKIAFEKPELPCPAIICSRGYNSLALKELFRGISIAHKHTPVEIWYSGDFDPEGLHIAQLLIDELSDMVKLWKFSLSDYDKAGAFMKEIELGKREKLLDSLENPDLREIGKKIKETRNVSYQEVIVDELTSDIINYMESV